MSNNGSGALTLAKDDPIWDPTRARPNGVISRKCQSSVEDKEGKLDYERSIILIRVPLHLEFSAQSEAKRF